MAKRRIVVIEDGSDRTGLSAGQIIRVNGEAGVWEVLAVLPRAANNGRTYEIERVPGNRHLRRVQAALKREAKT